MKVFALFLLSVIFISGCNIGSSTDVIKLLTESKKAFGEISLSKINTIIVENRVGGIELNGVKNLIQCNFIFTKQFIQKQK